MLSALAFAAVMAQDSFTLKWVPSKGETHVYELFTKDAEMALEASIEHSVMSVGRDGSYEVRSKSLGAFLRFGAQEIRDDRPNEAIGKFDAFGRIQSLKEGTVGPEKYRHALLTRFVAPTKAVKPGDKWTDERPKDKFEGVGASTTQYTLKVVKDGVAEVAFVFTEKGVDSPQTATGTWWVDARTGLPRRLEAKVKNFLGSENPNTDVTLALKQSP